MALWDPLGALATIVFVALGLGSWFVLGPLALFNVGYIEKWFEHRGEGHVNWGGFRNTALVTWLSLFFQVVIWPTAGAFMWTSCVTTTILSGTLVFSDEDGCTVSAIWLSAFIFFIATWFVSMWWLRALVRVESPLYASFILLAQFAFAGVADGLFWAVSAWAAGGVMAAYLIWSLYLLIAMIGIAAGDRMELRGKGKDETVLLNP